MIILCRTSNPHSGDLQNLVADGKALYEHVAELVRDEWNWNGNAGLVVGARYVEEEAESREMCTELPLVVLGVGAQGGSVAEVVKHGATADWGRLMINSSRGIIFAGKGTDFGEAAGVAAKKLRDEIHGCRK